VCYTRIKTNKSKYNSWIICRLQ